MGMLGKKIKVGNHSTLNVVLEESAENMDEVVVVGYGSMKKRDLSGAVAKIGGDELMNGTSSNSFNQALQGKLAGVTVNQTDGARCQFVHDQHAASLHRRWHPVRDGIHTNEQGHRRQPDEHERACVHQPA